MTGSPDARRLNDTLDFTDHTVKPISGQPFDDDLDLSAISTLHTPSLTQKNSLGTPPSKPKKPRRLFWSIDFNAVDQALSFSTASTPTSISPSVSEDRFSQRSIDDDSVPVVKPAEKTIFVMSLDKIDLDDNIPSPTSAANEEALRRQGEIHITVLVLLVFLEKQIEKLQKEEHGWFFFLFYSMPATLKKIDIFRDTLKQIRNDFTQPKTLTAIHDMTSRLAHDSAATSNRGLFGFGASESKRGLTVLSMQDHQAELRKILQDELEKISVYSPEGDGSSRVPKKGYINTLFYSPEKTQAKIDAVQIAISDLNESSWNIDSFNVFLQDLLKDGALCQHRSCGLFGKHLNDSTTKQKIAALSQKVAQGAEASVELFMEAERRYGG